ncbi:predicted protein [Naegleria gruberi]|uniref:Predicted protein n=1 Tax=Naegleria gruberi TaxID=5762 RepID=D2W2A7_NAEGR|nr:uncharacterized protein NAEGRDRAFT_54149 [Naegleria gruberi]EFC36831.1 predicted protein [Naegleria gruberi]|eukprot:XP_002669575.1 predicted protein [Naegleria gruberi strain NEG-M]
MGFFCCNHNRLVELFTIIFTSVISKFALSEASSSISKDAKNQIIDYDTFTIELKKQFQDSFLGSLWNSITRSKLITLDEILLFIKRHPPQIENVENLVGKLKKEFRNEILDSQLKRVKIEESLGLTIEAEFVIQMPVECEVMCWEPIKTNMLIHRLEIWISKQAVLRMKLICKSDLKGWNENSSLEWKYDKPDNISTRFKQGFLTELITFSDEKVSNGLLNGVFEIYGGTDKLFKYWKEKKISYSIKTGRGAILSNSKILFMFFKVIFGNAIYNVENVNYEKIDAMRYYVDFNNYLKPPLKAQRIRLSNISFYSACQLVSKFHPSLALNYHNMVTNCRGNATIGLEVKKNTWIGRAKKKKSIFDEKRFIYRFETAVYESYSKMPRNDYLPLEGFGAITPFHKKEIHLVKKVKLKFLSKIYEFSRDALKLTKTRPKIMYRLSYVNPLVITGHFEGTLQFLSNGETLLCESSFFIDTILGFIQLDLSHFGLGWCKFYKINSQNALEISVKCPKDVSIICLR